MSLQLLAWDSEFFGLPIGRASPGVPLDALAAAACDLGLQCVYLEAGERLKTHPACDVVVVDERVELIASTTGSEPEPDVRDGLAGDIEALSPAVDLVASWSRFARDPRFGPSEARRLYQRWLEQAATGSERLGIVETEDRATGFVTVREATRPSIGLISTSRPGKGHGSQLVRWAKHVARDAGELEVATQADNAAALRLYSQHGFRRHREVFVHHVWLKDVE